MWFDRRVCDEVLNRRSKAAGSRELREKEPVEGDVRVARGMEVSQREKRSPTRVHDGALEKETRNAINFYSSMESP